MSEVEADLEHLIGDTVPDLETIEAWCVNDNVTAGARRDAVRLLLWTRTRIDLANQSTLPRIGSSDVELHHLWPKKWLSSNRTGALGAYLTTAEAEQKDVINSAANLVPLTAVSNKEWRDKSPGQVLEEKRVTFATVAPEFESAFVDKEVFDLLLQGDGTSFGPAVQARGRRIASAILEQTRLRV
jgi:hypothetical protein